MHSVEILFHLIAPSLTNNVYLQPTGILYPDLYRSFDHFLSNIFVLGNSNETILEALFH